MAKLLIFVALVLSGLRARLWQLHWAAFWTVCSLAFLIVKREILFAAEHGATQKMPWILRICAKRGCGPKTELDCSWRRLEIWSDIFLKRALINA